MLFLWMAVTPPNSKISESNKAGNIAKRAEVPLWSVDVDIFALQVAWVRGVETEGALTLQSASASFSVLLVKIALPPSNVSIVPPSVSLARGALLESCLQVATTSQLLQARPTKFANDGAATKQLSRQSC